MNLTLKKPIVFFDLETTGIDVYRDRIVQIGAIRIESDGSKTEHEWVVNPQIPIPQTASAIHGITDEIVKDAPTLGDISEALSLLFYNADLGGYNIRNFDVPLLRAEATRIGLQIDFESAKIVDGMSIFKIQEPRTLTAAYKKYCNKELIDAHDAIADIRATLEVVEGQIAYYDNLPSSVEEIHEFCFPTNPDSYDAEGKLLFVNGELTINFGKNRGKTLQTLSMEDPGYLEWILNGSFSEKVKEAVRNALQGRQ